MEAGEELEEDVFQEDEDSCLLTPLDPDTSDLPATPVSLRSLVHTFQRAALASSALEVFACGELSEKVVGLIPSVEFVCWVLTCV